MEKKLKAQVPATAHRRVPPTARRRTLPTAATAPRATNPRVMRRVGSSSTHHAGEHTRVRRASEQAAHCSGTLQRYTGHPSLRTVHAPWGGRRLRPACVRVPPGWPWVPCMRSSQDITWTRTLAGAASAGGGCGAPGQAGQHGQAEHRAAGWHQDRLLGHLFKAGGSPPRWQSTSVAAPRCVQPCGAGRARASRLLSCCERTARPASRLHDCSMISS